MDKQQTCSASKEETSSPVAPEDSCNCCWNDKAHEYDQLEIPSVLPLNSRISGQVRDISDTRFSARLNQHPADVRPKEALVCVIRIKFGIGVAMVSTMSSRPPTDGSFDSTGTSQSKSVL